MKHAFGANSSTARGGSGGARALPLQPVTVLHIDDDPNDTALLQAAIRHAALSFSIQNVQDGDEAIAYLSGAEPYNDRCRYPLPSLILLDLKLPRQTGHEILKWIRNHPGLAQMPVVVLSGSELKEDIKQAYVCGANSYVVKPIGFEALVGLVKNIGAVWLATRPV